MKPLSLKPVSFYPKKGVQARRPRQQGVALIVALILLVVMTLLGLSAMRSVTLEEKMAANTFDRSVSFQTAEAMLREAEAKLSGTAPAIPTTSDCVGGICKAPDAGSEPRWVTHPNCEAMPSVASVPWQPGAAVVNGSITVVPTYFIEHLGDGFPCNPNDINSTATCKRYRVTACSNPGEGRAVVMLQSVYATP